MSNNNKTYDIGIDQNTSAIGISCVDQDKNPIQYHDYPYIKTFSFKPAETAEKWRMQRGEMRRRKREISRKEITKNMFKDDISLIDPDFFERKSKSMLKKEDKQYRFSLFEDVEYTDREFHKEYPTINHLIEDLKTKEDPDPRLVYIALNWFMSHRGHFNSKLSVDEIDKLMDFRVAYEEFEDFFVQNNYTCPWSLTDMESFKEALTLKAKVKDKEKAIKKIAREDFATANDNGKSPCPYSAKHLIKLLAGGKCKLKDVTKDPDVEGSISLSMEEDVFQELLDGVDENAATLMEILRGVYNWALMYNIIGNHTSLSEAKIASYDQHKKDLQNLKRIVKKYCPEKYNEIFRGADNYAAYIKQTNKKAALKASQSKTKDETEGKKKAKGDPQDPTNFLSRLGKLLTGLVVDEGDKPLVDDMLQRIEIKTFLPKQKTSDNRVIAKQFKQAELIAVLNNYVKYHPDWKVPEEDGFSKYEKILIMFDTRIPYFVGPTNSHSERSWFVRREGMDGVKITPWNIEKVIDYDKTEQAFIDGLIGKCTYLRDEKVLPRCSMLYQTFSVLNLLNTVAVNGERLSVEDKQEIFKTICLQKKTVKKSDIEKYMKKKGYEDVFISGMDDEFTSDLSTIIAIRKIPDFKHVTGLEIFSKDPAQMETYKKIESMILRSSCAEDKSRLDEWLKKNFPQLDDICRKKLCSIKASGFGNLSERFLTGLVGADKETGEMYSIIQAMWDTNNNLMELLSENRFTFMEEINKNKEEYYKTHPVTMEQIFEDMHASAPVRRQVSRSVRMINEARHRLGSDPNTVYIETTRTEGPKKRSKPRRETILDLYEKVDSISPDKFKERYGFDKSELNIEELRAELNSLGEYANNTLQSKSYFLYFMQFGYSAYSRTKIDFKNLKGGDYDVDHIIPKSIKNDNGLTNRVLCLCTENGNKDDRYPLDRAVQQTNMRFWNFLCDIGAINKKKFGRLSRTAPLTKAERICFVDAQLTEVSQANKILKEVLENVYGLKVVFTKAEYVSDFRKEYNIPKSRALNVTHHGIDAYLTAVVGSVYHKKFAFLRDENKGDKKYSINITAVCGDAPYPKNTGSIWNGKEMRNRIIQNALNAKVEIEADRFIKKGQLFDMQIVAPKPGLIPIKKGLPPEKYGGYDKRKNAFFVAVKFTTSKGKSKKVLMPVEVGMKDKFLLSKENAETYAKERLKLIYNKEILSVEFTDGLNPIPINTAFTHDGLRMIITGVSGGGSRLCTRIISQLTMNRDDTEYIVKLEKFIEKANNNKGNTIVHDSEHDKITAEKNIKLFDKFICILTETKWKNRPNNPVKTLENGRNEFVKLEEAEQAVVLINIIQLFNQEGSGGVDLRLIGGKKNTGAFTLSALIA